MESDNILTKYMDELCRVPRKWLELCMDNCVKELNAANQKRIDTAIERQIIHGE